MSEEASKHTQQAEANPSKTPPPPPRYEPDPDLIIEAQRTRYLSDRRSEEKDPGSAPND